MESDFSPDERARARAYHRPLYLALLVDVALGAGLLAALAWTSLGHWLFSPLTSLSPVAAAAAYAALVTAFSSVVRAPLACWRGWWRERKWGFSTQGAGGWVGDRAKGLAVSVVLGAGAWAAAVALARALPGWWALPAAAALALAVLLLSFVAPVVLEPLFNRFRPLDDATLAGSLRRLSERARSPCATCSSPTRAAARRRSTPTCRGWAARAASSSSTRCCRRPVRPRSRSSSRTSSGTGVTGTS